MLLILGEIIDPVMSSTFIQNLNELPKKYILLLDLTTLACWESGFGFSVSVFFALSTAWLLPKAINKPLLNCPSYNCTIDS